VNTPVAQHEFSRAAPAQLAVWKTHLAALAVLTLALGAVFWSDIQAAATVWWIYPAYSHCFLIIPISAWLIWERKDTLASDTPAAMPAALLGAIPFVALWFIGRFASITEARQFALVGLMEVFIAAVLGWHIFRKIAFACLYLVFLVPTGQYLIPPLQQVTAKFVETGLNLFSIPYFRDGLQFQLVNGRYEIAEACAGLRFLIATLALGTLFAHMMYRKWFKVVLFIAACLIVPVIGNGIRALVTVMVANYTSNKVAAGFDHLVYGWVFAVAILFLVMFVGQRFRDPEADIAPPSGSFRPSRYPLLAATLTGALALLCIGPAAAWYAESRPSGASQPALEALAAPAGWQKQAGASDWHIAFAPGAADATVQLAQRDSAPVDVNINYYIRQRGTPSLLASLNQPWDNKLWHPTQRRNITHASGGANIALDETIIQEGEAKRLVWTTYWVDGRFTTSSLALRLLELESGIFHGHSAVVALSTPITASEDEARARLGGALAAFGDLSAGLTKVGDLPAQKR
jgi:exosortase A